MADLDEDDLLMYALIFCRNLYGSSIEEVVGDLVASHAAEAHELGEVMAYH